MSRHANCPSCGAPVTFRCASSILAVCEYCRTTLLNVDGRVEDLGKMAELAEDRSEGSYGNVSFTVVGRIQLEYSQGFWNEWFLLFDNGVDAWLSEAGGSYAIYTQRPPPSGLPGFADLKPGDRLDFEGDAWIVSNLERSECVAGEGELPFKVGAGYPAPVADLRSRSGKGVATLDYSEDAPLLFVGKAVDFSSLKWRNLREESPLPTGPRVQEKALRCAQCGAPLEIKHDGILSVGCAQCGGVTDTETKMLISAIEKSQKVVPRIPVGKKGKLFGVELEVIGFMQRYMTVDGKRYSWGEYLLAYIGKPGYCWLTEYNDHWNAVEVLEEMPGRHGDHVIAYRGRHFEHFQEYRATVAYVTGEFTWRVKIGETAWLADYVAPPMLLSLERTDREISWSLGAYVSPEDMAAGFGCRMPRPIGVYANQPSPYEESYRLSWRWFGIFSMLAFLLQLIFTAFPGKQPAPWGNLFILLIVLAVWPWMNGCSRSQFENARWDESDHPRSSGVSDDD